MKAATERKIIRWLHIIISIPIIGYIYGQVPEKAVYALRYVFLPVVVVSGLWLWKGHLLRKRRRRTEGSLLKR